MIELYPDQVKVIEDLRTAYREGAKAPLLAAPTGFGKTVCFAAITKGTAAKGKRVTILVHRQELVDQVSDALTAFSVPHGRITPDAPITGHPVQVASVFTLARRLARISA